MQEIQSISPTNTSSPNINMQVKTISFVMQVRRTISTSTPSKQAIPTKSPQDGEGILIFICPPFMKSFFHLIAVLLSRKRSNSVPSSTGFGRYSTEGTVSTVHSMFAGFIRDSVPSVDMKNIL
jgi:hypothetical protein